MNMLNILATETTLKKGTKIKIKYEYKKVEKIDKRNEDFRYISCIKENGEYCKNNSILCKRTIYVPEYKQDAIISKVKQIKDTIMNMNVDFNRNCIIKFFLKNEMELQCKLDNNSNVNVQTKKAGKYKNIFLFMIKNDLLFNQKSAGKNDGTSLKVNEKTRSISIDSEKDNKLIFSCFGVSKGKKIYF